MQDGESQGADQDDVAGGGVAGAPLGDNPAEQQDGDADHHHGMHQPQYLDVAQALPPGGHLQAQRPGQARALPMEAAEGADQRHVGDDIGHLAVDRGGLVGEVAVDRPAPGRVLEQHHHQKARKHGQRGGHRQADAGQIGDRADRRHARRQHVPHKEVFDGEERVRGRGDAAGQHAGQTVGEIPWRMAHQMAEQIGPDVAGIGDDGPARDPPGDAPGQVVAGDQRDQQAKGEPNLVVAGRSGRQRVDQELDAVLRADRAACGDHDRGNHQAVRPGPRPDIVPDKGQRPVREPGDVADREGHPPIAGRVRHLFRFAIAEHRKTERSSAINYSILTAAAATRRMRQKRRGI